MSTPRGRGRATKLTPAIHTAIVQAVTGGVAFEQAAALAGIRAKTALEWLARGEDRDPDRPQTPLYAAFAEDIARARAQDEARRIAQIREAAEGGVITEETTTVCDDGRTMTTRRYLPPDWRAAAWWLERKYPERYSLRVLLDVNIHALAAQVAARFGLDAQEVLREAQAILDGSWEARNR